MDIMWLNLNINNKYSFVSHASFSPSWSGVMQRTNCKTALDIIYNYKTVSMSPKTVAQLYHRI